MMQENEIIYEASEVTEETPIIDESNAEIIEVEIFEAFQAPTASDSFNHALLTNREIHDAHPITAITGLREELDSIEALQTFYSDKHNVANYYKWNDAAYDEYGYFVSIAPGTSEIKICDGADILGVSVGEAGFVGGQDATPRDNSYGLIATSGLVDVRCELDVEVGGYVVSNEYGIATKSKSNYGYKVLAKETKQGVEYAVIMLGVQADKTMSLDMNLTEVEKRVSVNEKNIVSAINVANQAYKQSQEAAESSSVSAEVVKEALKSILDSEEKIEEFEKVVESTSSTSAQARAIAEAAVTEAASIKTEAITRANDAWAKADEVQTETYSLCAKIDKHSVGEYSQAYGLTLEQAQSILEIGMIYVPTRHEEERSHTEKYSYTVGNETKVYSRTFTPGYLYEWRETPNSEIGIGWVTVDKNYGETTEADADETSPINTSAMAVYFSNTEIAINDDNKYGYWYTDADTIYDIGGQDGKYDPYTLYHWENGHWLAVATLKGNASNRMVSEVYQTTNQITMGVANPRGCIAAIDARLTDTSSEVQSLSSWKNGGETSESIIRQCAEDGKSSIVIATVQENEGVVSEMASLVLSASKNDGTALVMSADNIDFEAENFTIDADHIVLKGGATFVTEDETDGTTKIDGGKIATGSIKAEQIDAGAITADHLAADAITADKITTGLLKSKGYSYISGRYSTSGTAIDLDTGYVRSKKFAITESGDAYFNGTLGANTVSAIKISADNITAGTIDAGDVTITNLNADNITSGTLKAVVIESNGYVSGVSGIKLDLANGTADITGKITTTEGKIGGWNLGKTSIQISPTTQIEDYALYSDVMTDKLNGKTYTYRVYLTAKGVYVDGLDGEGGSYYADKSWLELCGG